MQSRFYRIGLTIFIYLFFYNYLSLSAIVPDTDIPVSLTGKLPALQAINQAYFEYLALLQQYAAHKTDYFRRGLGWQNKAYHGFESGNHSLYFSKTQSGIRAYNPQGKQIHALYLDQSKPVYYATFEWDQGQKLVVGIEQQKITWIEWTFSDKSTVSATENMIRIMLPDRNDYYMLYYFNDEPFINLSPSLSARIFYSEKGAPEIINAVYEDFPNLYYTRILKAAIEAKLTINNEDKLSLFAVNWFRKLTGLPEISIHPKLMKAAKNHADYLIINDVIKNMMSWNSADVNMDAYLEMHNETTGKKQFTGTHVSDRTAYTGYGTNTSECANMSRLEVLAEAVGWFHTIFHRRPYVDQRMIACGQGHSHKAGIPQESAGIINWGYDWGKDDNRFYVYPAKDETLVPFAWSGYEAPDPFPADQSSLGPVITVSYNNLQYRNGTLKLFNDSGKEVSCLISSVLNSPDYFLEITPADPLEPGNRYTIRFDYPGGTYTHDFTTAPLNPVEISINDIKKTLAKGFDLNEGTFDLTAAVKAGEKKGDVITEKTAQGLVLHDKKYGFQIKIPEGWETGEREWQEILFKRSWHTISLFLYAGGRGNNPDKVMKNLSAQIKYKLKELKKISTDYLTGYRAEYTWQYENKVIIYYLVYADYALGIYGYGVKPEDIDPVFQSFMPDN